MSHELNKVQNGSEMQDALKDITGQRTVPNIFIGGQHIGGCDDLKAKIKNGKIIEILEANAIHYSL